MSKFKSCYSIFVGLFAFAVLLSVVLSWFVVCADDEFEFGGFEIVDQESLKIITDTFTEVANKAELTLDGQRTWYCQEFQSQFYNNQSAWSAVKKQCIDPLAINPPIPHNWLIRFPNVNQEKVHTNVLELHQKCSNLMENPCFEADWLKVKKCVRDGFMSIPYGGIELFLNLETLLVERTLVSALLLDSEISKCTFKTLASNSSGP